MSAAEKPSLIWVGFLTFITVALVLSRFLPMTPAVLVGAVIGGLAGRLATSRSRS